MSKIQKLPQNVRDAITPYLLTGEVIDRALLQDNKKPKEIWLIKTNQAIILHGTQPDKPQPAIMVMALDELREIDYLQKNDDIQVILYSCKNNGKAVFHFEKTAAKEIETFFEDLGDIITFRYQTDKGKISVVQKALPIGHKDRKVFGRGKTPEVPFLAKTKPSKPVIEKTPLVPEKKDIPLRTTESKVEPPKNTVTQKLPEEKTVKTVANIPEKVAEKPANEPKVQQTSVKTADSITAKPENKKSNEVVSSKEKTETIQKEDKATNKVTNTATKAPVKSTTLISHLQENPVPPKEEPKEESKSKEIDFGSPVYYIGVTIIATIVGFFCLSFFNLISKVVKYFKKH